MTDTRDTAALVEMREILATRKDRTDEQAELERIVRERNRQPLGTKPKQPNPLHRKRKP